MKRSEKEKCGSLNRSCHVDVVIDEKMIFQIIIFEFRDFVFGSGPIPHPGVFHFLLFHLLFLLIFLDDKVTTGAIEKEHLQPIQENY